MATSGCMWLLCTGKDSESKSLSVVSDSLRPHGLYSPWNSPGQNTGMGSLSLLQGIFPTQGSNPGLPHCKWILYQLSHKEAQVWLLLLLSRFSHVRLCDPIDGSPPGSPVLGFSRQEQWSGLPFPSPVHESEKWKWSCSAVSDSSRPHGLRPTRLLRPWDFPGKSTGVGCHCLLHGHVRYALNI